MKIKICGLQTKEAVDEAVKSGATHLGFILSKSRRQITPEKLSRLTVNVPKSVKKVGVFVNEPIDFVKNAVQLAGLDMVQLHGTEDMDYIHQLDLPVIKAVSNVEQASHYENVTLLLDSPKGGSGQQFDWNSVKSDALKLSFFVAGGLNPENVTEAISYFPTAYGVDVSSGVETDGVKDLAKIRKFIRNAQLGEFLRISQELTEIGINPYLLGSLGVQYLLTENLVPDDIDIQLISRDLARFDEIVKLMKGLGYELTDLHEHKFSDGRTYVGFGSADSLEAWAGIRLTEIPEVEISTVKFRLPTIAQFVKIYEAAVTDDWRKGKLKDKIILEKLRKALR